MFGKRHYRAMKRSKSPVTFYSPPVINSLMPIAPPFAVLT
jgi:hypothetical protein